MFFLLLFVVFYFSSTWREEHIPFLYRKTAWGRQEIVVNDFILKTEEEVEGVMPIPRLSR
jgi:hypothetical protein